NNNESLGLLYFVPNKQLITLIGGAKQAHSIREAISVSISKLKTSIKLYVYGTTHKINILLPNYFDYIGHT
ncbi:hypothetical protein ACJX0J_015154, partial [Zea mays]